MKPRVVHDDGDSERKAGTLVGETEAPFEMANLRPSSTGLPMTIWVSERGRARHGPRLKVSLQHGPKIDIRNTVSVTLEEPPRVIGGELGTSDCEAIRHYLEINRQALLAFWNGELDTLELIARLKPLSGP